MRTPHSPGSNHGVSVAGAGRLKRAHEVVAVRSRTPIIDSHIMLCAGNAILVSSVYSLWASRFDRCSKSFSQAPRPPITMPSCADLSFLNSSSVSSNGNRSMGNVRPGTFMTGHLRWDRGVTAVFQDSEGEPHLRRTVSSVVIEVEVAVVVVIVIVIVVTVAGALQLWDRSRSCVLLWFLRKGCLFFSRTYLSCTPTTTSGTSPRPI